MDLGQALVFDVSWVFFAAWTTVLTALIVIAFGRDLLGFSEPHPGHKAER